MERRKQFWNGRWGHLARHDIIMFEDAGAWLVEDRRGGTDGRSQRYPCDSQDDADERVRRLLDGGDGWRELR